MSAPHLLIGDRPRAAFPTAREANHFLRESPWREPGDRAYRCECGEWHIAPGSTAAEALTAAE